jgi:universal stress protein E
MNELKSILVAVDFSRGSAAALGQAMRIGAWNRSQVRVVHVLATLVVLELQDALSAIQENISQALIEDAQKAWAEFAAKVPGAASLPFDMEINSPQAAVIRRCHEQKADLLVLGVRGVGTSKGVGVVATSLVRRSPADVLLVQDPHTGPYTTVVACIDFSETSRRALDQAIRVATQDSAGLHIIHVYQAPWHRLGYKSPNSTANPEFEAQYKQTLQRRLEEFCEPCHHELAYLKPTFQIVDHSSDGYGIGSYAKQIGADLVVLGTHGRTNLRDIFLGSTAERVLREAPCSILAVKPAGA